MARLLATLVLALSCVTSLLGLPSDASAAAPQQAPQGTLIVLNKSGNDASFIDPSTGRTWLTLPTGEGPHEVAVSPDGTLAVVTDYGAATDGHTLTVYDLARGEVKDTIELGPFRRPHGVQFLGRSSKAVVTVESQRAVLVVDVAAGEVLKAIPTNAGGSHMVVTDPEGTRAYVANMGAGSVSVLDLEEGVYVRSVSTGAECEGIAVTPDGREVWATNRRDDTISVIDTESLEVVAELACPGFPIRIEITPDGRRALVSNAMADEVAVFDVPRREELGRIVMDRDVVDGAGTRLFGSFLEESSAPIGIVAAPDGRHAYVANSNADVVSVLDLEELEVVGGFRAGRQPDGIAWAPLRARTESPAGDP